MAMEKRVLKWANERFPVVHVISSFTIYFLTFFVARSSNHEGVLSLGFTDFANALGVTAQFLLLRIYDEHKDFETDSVLYPDRVLQSGGVSLRELKILGWICVLYSFILSAFHGIPALIGWGGLNLWALLMYFEFFCAAWLRTRLLLYAFSHMLIVPFLIYWILTLGVGVNGNEGVLLYLTALAFVSGLTFEITRKMRGKEEELPLQDSYSKTLGLKGGTVLLSFVLFGVLALQTTVLYRLPVNPLPYLFVSVFGFLLSLFSVFRYYRTPTLKKRKGNEAATGLFMLLNYLGIIIAVILHFGVRFAVGIPVGNG